MPESPEKQASIKKDSFYGLGILGSSTIGFLVNNWLLYFYLPPDDEPLIPVALSGFVIFAGRVVAALITPYVGYLSDNAHYRWGRRFPFMLVAILPLATMTRATQLRLRKFYKRYQCRNLLDELYQYLLNKTGQSLKRVILAALCVPAGQGMQSKGVFRRACLRQPEEFPPFMGETLRSFTLAFFARTHFLASGTPCPQGTLCVPPGEARRGRHVASSIPNFFGATCSFCQVSEKFNF